MKWLSGLVLPERVNPRIAAVMMFVTGVVATGVAVHAARHVCHAVPVFRDVFLCGFSGVLMSGAYGAIAAAAFGKGIAYATLFRTRRILDRAVLACLLIAGATASIAIAMRIFAGFSPSVAAHLFGPDVVTPTLPRFQCPGQESGVGAFCAAAAAIALGGIAYWLRHETRRVSEVFALAGAAMLFGGLWFYQNDYVALKVWPVGRTKCISYYANPELFDSAVLVSDVTLVVLLVGILLRVIVVLRA